MAQCYFCGAAVTAEKIYRTSVCPACGKDLKVCRNCAFYAPGSHWDCRETISEAVRDKERANFCDSFSPADRTSGGAGKLADAGKKAKAMLDGLFGN